MVRTLRSRLALEVWRAASEFRASLYLLGRRLQGMLHLHSIRWGFRCWQGFRLCAAQMKILQHQFSEDHSSPLVLDVALSRWRVHAKRRRTIMSHIARFAKRRVMEFARFWFRNRIVQQCQLLSRTQMHRSRLNR
eukprot:2416201-Prymnesium_polylepis.1